MTGLSPQELFVAQLGWRCFLKEGVLGSFKLCPNQSRVPSMQNGFLFTLFNLAFAQPGAMLPPHCYRSKLLSNNTFLCKLG